MPVLSKIDGPAPALPFETIPAAQLAKQTAPLSWLAEGLFLFAGAGILGGAPKSCKSYFALDLCVSVASGTPCAGHFAVPTPGPVTLLSVEDPHAVVVARLRALACSRGLQLDALPIEVIVEPSVRLPEGIDRLAATVARSRPSLLLLDPLIRLHRADENSAAEMSVILDGLRNLARSSKTAVLVVHHARKAPAGSSSGAALRGSSDLAAFGDSNLYLRKLSHDAALELRIEQRAIACPPPMRLKLVVDGAAEPNARFIVDGASSDDPISGKVLALIVGAAEAVSSSAIREKLGVRNQLVAQALRALLERGRIRRAGRDGWLAVGAPG